METLLDKNIYPIGKFVKPDLFHSSLIDTWIADIAALPANLHHTVHHLSSDDLNKTYRDGGWNIRQIVHHIADSHINAYIRFKLALSEDSPMIMPYKQDLWAMMSDTKEVDITVSVKLLEALHTRWVAVLQNMTNDDFEKVYVHPEYNRIFVLNEALGIYSWHGKHHVGQIQAALKR